MFLCIFFCCASKPQTSKQELQHTLLLSFPFSYDLFTLKDTYLQLKWSYLIISSPRQIQTDMAKTTDCISIIKSNFKQPLGIFLPSHPSDKQTSALANSDNEYDHSEDCISSAIEPKHQAVISLLRETDVYTNDIPPVDCLSTHWSTYKAILRRWLWSGMGVLNPLTPEPPCIAPSDE